MTILLRGCDTAVPPDDQQITRALTEDVKWWGGYFGGHDAFNVWEPADFVRVGDHFKMAPIWVPQQAPADFSPSNTIDAMLHAAHNVYDIPAGKWLVLDAETALSAFLNANPAIQEQLSRGISDGGYKLLVYGGGVLVVPEWKASWYGTAWPTSLPTGANVKAWQWSSGSASVFVPGADLDVMTQALFDGLWDGKPATAPATVSTDTATAPTAAENVSTPTLAESSSTALPVNPSPEPTVPSSTVREESQNIKEALDNISSAVTKVNESLQKLHAAVQNG